MYFLETSKDILNISISVAVISVAFFICWVLLYFALSFRKIHNIIGDIAKTVNAIKEKTENFTAYFLLIGEGIKKILEYIKDSEGRRKTKKIKDDQEIED